MKRNSTPYIKTMEYIDNLPIETQDFLYTVAGSLCGKPKNLKKILGIIKVNCPDINAATALQVLMDYTPKF